jgi:hypothetical protein
MNSSGIIYLANQEWDIPVERQSTKQPACSDYDYNPGSMIVGMIEPQGNGVFSLTGYTNYAPGAPSMLRKTTATGSNPTLVQ